MTHLFVPYEQALELKELGFDEPCFASIDNFSKTPYIPSKGGTYFNSKDYGKETVACPLYQQAFHFFREKYGLMHIINPYDFTGEINYLNKRVVNDVYGDFIPHDHLVDDEGEEIKHLSYEDAENACLLELINICKKK
jgi:hypothetical protein